MADEHGAAFAPALLSLTHLDFVRDSDTLARFVRQLK
jgi:hypothetical protein